MSTLRIKGYVYAEIDEFGTYGRRGEYRCIVWPGKPGSAAGFGTCVGEIDVPYTLPEGFNLEAETLRQKIAALEAEKEKAGQEFAEKVARINRQLAELQAIEMEPAS